jgi:hypothetical protein
VRRHPGVAKQRRGHGRRVAWEILSLAQVSRCGWWNGCTQTKKPGPSLGEARLDRTRNRRPASVSLTLKNQEVRRSNRTAHSTSRTWRCRRRLGRSGRCSRRGFGRCRFLRRGGAIAPAVAAATAIPTEQTAVPPATAPVVATAAGRGALTLRRFFTGGRFFALALAATTTPSVATTAMTPATPRAAAAVAKQARLGLRAHHQQRGTCGRQSQRQSNHIALHQSVLQNQMDLTLNLENQCGTLPCLQDLGAEKKPSAATSHIRGRHQFINEYRRCDGARSTSPCDGFLVWGTHFGNRGPEPAGNRQC